MVDLKVLLKEDEIQKRLSEMAKEIDEYYKGEEILVICVLRGAIYFFTDLTKKMKTPMQPDFIRISSYNGTETTQKINIINDLCEDIKGKKVLVVEDIIDTGYTLKYLKQYLLSKEPEDLKIVVCHIGQGASLCAVQDGKSVETSMGLTPLGRNYNVC